MSSVRKNFAKFALGLTLASAGIAAAAGFVPNNSPLAPAPVEARSVRRVAYTYYKPIARKGYVQQVIVYSDGTMQLGRIIRGGIG